MKVVVFNVKYSENLGDGILAMCIEKGLMRGAETLEVETVDLAGRNAFGMTHSRRQWAIRILHRLPSFFRRLAVACVLKRSLAKVRQEWERKIAASDAVVIGGGNLFQDDDLNFPLKIGALLDCVRRTRRPLAIYAVGVSRHWSSRAGGLFGRLRQTNLAHVSVRDTFASENWKVHFPDGPEADIVPDPGLLARDLIETADLPMPSPATSRMIGICVTEPIILQRHASQAVGSIPFRKAEDYRSLIAELVADGYRVCLFCNGAAEDQRFAEAILGDPFTAEHVSSGKLWLAQRPTTPEAVLEILRSTGVILAHRLHACIAAYSLGIPCVGLGWDKKVEEFFRSTGREGYFVNGGVASGQQIRQLLEAALASGIEPHRHAAKLDEARAGLARLQQALIGASKSGVHKYSHSRDHALSEQSFVINPNGLASDVAAKHAVQNTA
jgi:polysaccharide pyruvyl transferase WcaK-like protein